MMIENQDSYSRFEKAAIGFCSVIVCLCFYLLFQDSSELWNQESFYREKIKIGFISDMSNDARRKSAGALVWFQTKENESIHLGDSVYAGANSQLHISLDQSGNIDVGENSLITFSRIENENLANLENGNFRLNVNGTLKIAVNGELTTLQGTGSEVQIYLEKNKKPVVKVLAGQISIKNKLGNMIQATPGKITQLEPAEKPLQLETPINLQAQNQEYHWQLYDLYEQNGLFLEERTTPPSEVQQRTLLEWNQPLKQNFRIQVANNIQFEGSIEEKSDVGKIELETVFLARNYWRVSADQGQTWSIPQSFSISGKILANAEPRLLNPLIEVPLLNEKSTVELDLLTAIETSGYVVQASQTPEFKAKSSRIFWSPNTKPLLSFYKPGRYYYRFRSITPDQKISDWSQTQEFQVFIPELPKIPTLGFLSHKILDIGQTLNLKWKSSENEIITLLLNEKEEKISELSGHSIDWIPKIAGTYRVRSYAVDQYGQRSPSSLTEIVKVRALQPLAIENSKERTPSALESSKENFKSPSAFYNENYNGSIFSVKGLVWNLQSSQQYALGQQSPIAFGVGLDYLKWGDRWGIQTLFKSGILSLNQTQQPSSMKDLEARLHYRFVTRFPFGVFRQLQTSVFVGYEFYQNSGNSYINQNELIKFGTALEFPVSSRWSTGGEFVYGFSADQSWKQEISGKLNYYLNSKWSAGVGYRINYYQAGSSARTPSGVLPYREGYTEGYSVINYHY
jgi:hypothetical protein